MRKPRILGRIGQHCLCFVDRISAAEVKECIGQHHRACGSPDTPQGQSQALSGCVQSPIVLLLKVWFVGSSENISREV